MSQDYQPQIIERDLQALWAKENRYVVEPDKNREKFYCLAMFPYPSGKLHMGHVRNYTIADVIARYQRMQGKNVLQPMGWDAFGLPAENAAIQNQVPPAEWTQQNIADMRRQLSRLGFAYDWSRELATCNPEYYRWEQWFFTKLMDRGLAYKKRAAVNWCETDQTVLANEQVVDGKCWRCDNPVERKEISQWFIKITAYAQELLDDLDTLSEWPEQVRRMQRNWIGKSEGATIRFPFADSHIEVYTTRPDTLMGATFLALAPQHSAIQTTVKTDPSLAAFCEQIDSVKIAEADMATMEKLGMDTGLTAMHPLTGEPVPIWVANFVLMGYGSGAVMCVPAHDQRDWEFATKYKLPIIQVIADTPDKPANLAAEAYVDRGCLMNSRNFDGLNFEVAFEAIIEQLESQKLGERSINFRLRDWGISRQRYWGTPIPVINCPRCGSVPVPDHDLPVVLPTDVSFQGVSSPIKKMEDFYQTDCPRCNQPAIRETDTFDTFMESSWYYARYTNVDNPDAMLDQEANYWLQVDQYVGGIEHAILHLLYARFFHKLMRDEGLLTNDEPFKRLLTQGMVLKDGAKMSKSRGNTVDPQQLIDKYGADTLRLFSMFAAPPEQTLEWSDSGVEGSYRFIKRLWRLVHDFDSKEHLEETANLLNQDQRNLRRKIHETIAKVTDDYGRRQTFNTAIAAIMELCNELGKHAKNDVLNQVVVKEGLRSVLTMLWPITPHISEYLWPKITGHQFVEGSWPEVDPSALSRDEVEIVVQVNGKVRAKIIVPSSASDAELEALAKEQENVQRHLTNSSILKVIVVPEKLVNIVAR